MAAARIVRVGGQESDNRTLETLLRGVGITDARFLTPAEAVAAIAAHEVDVLFLDLMLKSADVFSVLLKAAPAGAVPKIPVIVTAPPSANDRIQACLSRGAEDYLHTPLDGENALSVTRRVTLALERRQLRDFTMRVSASNDDPKATAVLQLYTDASSRFIPREFLDNLERATLADVKLGDHVQRDMTVFFADIRDFTSLSEKLTPQQNFTFLNSYLKEVTPVIRARHGFIDKYIGDGIMALFPREPGDALAASVELQAAVSKYNLGRSAAGYPAVRIGIGMHRGEIILGTIGEEERMQTTVIADVVNVASRIEGLTKTFGVNILASGTVIDALEPGHTFKLRRLSAVKAKGKTQSVEIYECFNNDPDELVAHKLETLEPFNTGMEQFKKGMFLTAGRIFARIAQMNRDDKVAAYYRDRCTLDAVRDRGMTPWDGAEKIEVK